MSVFNKKYTEIIRLATEQDSELAEKLKFMLSKLSKEQKESCFNGEEFHDDENKTWFENFPRYGNNGTEITESYLMHEENGDTEYRLNVVNFNEEWLDELEVEEDVDDENVEHSLSEILSLEVYKFINGDTGDIDTMTTYSLELQRTKDGFKLDYMRYSSIGNNDTHPVVELNKIATISEKDIYDVAKLDNPLTVG